MPEVHGPINRVPVEFQAGERPCLPATVLSLCTAALSLSTSSRALLSSAGCLPRILVREEDRNASSRKPGQVVPACLPCHLILTPKTDWLFWTQGN